MPKTIVCGNGNLLVAMDDQNMMQDLYFPYVGMENQIGFEHMHRIGLYTENKFTWLYEKEWQHDITYIPDTLVTKSSAKNKSLNLTLNFNDFVYPAENIFIRKITIKNESDFERYIQLFFGQDFHIYGDKQMDTAFYEPEQKAMVHYRKRRYFWISGNPEGRIGIDSFTTGKSEFHGLEGTWRDAEDGHLHEHAIEQGSVDSTVQFNMLVKEKSEAVLYVWTCVGKNFQEVKQIHNFILKEGAEKLLQNTIHYWKSWVNKDNKMNRVLAKTLDPKIKNMFKQSLLIMRTQIDNRGAIIAANDSDIMKFNKDTYSYMWPRDGAWVALALDRAGYGEITKRFFRFCADIVTEDEGYLMPKYNPDKSLGSSWHPWYKHGKTHLPIQEDETAIVLYALWKHYQRFRDIEFVESMYKPLIRECGNFLTRFVDPKNNLPLPSYDLWERESGIFAYTSATVYAGLEAASKLCEITGHFMHKKRYADMAEKIKNAILEHLYDEESGRFLKRIEINPNTREIKKDYTIDASLHGLWLMGVLPPDDPRITKTNEAIFQALSVATKIGGLARFENDDYQRTGSYENIQGNPWIITTLWHAQWLLAIAKNKNDLKKVEDYLHWTVSRMNSAGILPEQMDPFTGMHLSVAPLTWSHASFVDTVLKYYKKLSSFI